MPDGFSRSPRPLLEDGVHLDCPLADYLADPALSGSAFKKLLSDPAGLYWESEANPLWLKPEPAANRARLRGSAAHCAILEGLDLYRQRYVVKPEGVLESKSDLKDWLSNKRQEFIAASLAKGLGGKLSKEDAAAVKQTGEREDLIARIHALDPSVPIWDPDDETETLHPADDQYVQLIERFVKSDTVFAPLVTGGLAEVTIVWTEKIAGRPVRFKARIDYLTAIALVDVKTYGQPPNRGQSLREHCVRAAGYNGYDLQAVHNARAVEVAAELHGGGNLEFNATARGDSNERIKRCSAILHAAHAKPPVFTWLFLRMGGAPTGIAIPFRESDGQWQESKRQVEDAVEIYAELAAQFGGEPWLVTYGQQEIEDRDWPLAAMGVAR